MGNFETKHSPYYAIKDESALPLGDNKSKYTEHHRFWTIKRAQFDSDAKNASLFEYNKTHKHASRQLVLALNQIKTLKTLRHPNIVKYFYSEEPPPSHCPLLITEFIRPLSSLIDNLNAEQIMHGIYNITSSLHFLHSKCKLSHNNLSENCIYLNCRQVWKLNDFELAISFDKLTRDTLKDIYEFKHKNAITPEEEASYKDIGNYKELDRTMQQVPHAIDAYGWALTILNLLPSENQVKSFKSFFGDDSGAGGDAKQLELYLSADPIERPNLESALKIGLFDLYRVGDETNSDETHLFKIDNLEELDQNFDKLLDYLCNLKPEKVNEKLIEFLLLPFMFYSDRMRREVFPMVFVPKEVYVNESNFQNQIDFNNFHFSVYHDFVSEKCRRNEMTMGVSIEPFMEMNKYKTFVVPRVLELMSMHSLQIRLVLLEYFPFYVGMINDEESLRYEVLPEMLLGLKDRNDELVSRTFACLSVIVKILGSEVVVGTKSGNNEKQSIFSEKLPKTISMDFVKEDDLKFKKPSSFQKHKSADFQRMDSNDNLGFNMNEKTKFSSATSLDQEMIPMGGSKKGSDIKLISDSMIALHGETDENVDLTRNASDTNFQNFNKQNGPKSNEIESSTHFLITNANSAENNLSLNGFQVGRSDEDDWSNDFGWNQETNEGGNYDEASASLLSLAGSVDLLVPPEVNELPKIKMNYSHRYLNNNSEIGSEYDIKSIVIKKSEGPDLIDELFNDMRPIIAKVNGFETRVNGTLPGLNKLLLEAKSTSGDPDWECEEVDLDEV